MFSQECLNPNEQKMFLEENRKYYKHPSLPYF